MDFERGKVFVESGKTEKARRVRMNPRVRTLLEQQRKRNREIARETDPARIIRYVFIDSAGEPWTCEGTRAEDREKSKARMRVVSRCIKRALHRLGLGHVRPFVELRHTAASWMVQGGRSLPEVKEILGHADFTTTQRYAHLSPEQLQQAVDVLDAGIDLDQAAEG